MSTATLVKKTFPALAVKAERPRSFRFTISTGSVDRERDTLAPSGWRLESYRANPVVLWAHDYTVPPIARAAWIGVMDGALKALAEFPPAGLHPLADQVHDLIAAGFLSSASVGFSPIKSVYNEARRGTDYLEQELLEFSIVSVPANPEAVVVARSQGIANRKALDRFFGAPRGSDRLVDPDAVRLAVRQFVESQVRQAVQGSRPVVLIDEPEPLRVDLGGGRVSEIRPRDLAAAVAEAMGQVVGTELRRALCRATGRVD